MRKCNITMVTDVACIRCSGCGGRATSAEKFVMPKKCRSPFCTRISPGFILRSPAPGADRFFASSPPKSENAKGVTAAASVAAAAPAPALASLAAAGDAEAAAATAAAAAAAAASFCCLALNIKIKQINHTNCRAALSRWSLFRCTLGSRPPAITTTKETLRRVLRELAMTRRD